MEESKKNIDNVTEKSEDFKYEKIVELYEKRFKIQENTLSTIIRTIAGIKVDSPSEIKVLWNIAGFVNIISYDIKIITRDMILTQDQWQKKHYARQASLIIYESINDLFELMGKDFKRLLRTYQAPELHLEIKGIRADLNLFKSNYQKKLYTIRNTSIAHRDKEALKQLLSIVQIDWNETLVMTFKFEEILSNLESFMHNILKEFMKNREKEDELRKN